jgi:uncharacterized phage protein gp47/JayE
MPWETPRLETVRTLVRDQVRGNLTGADATIPNSILRVLSDVAAALCHLTLQYIDWLAQQLLPDTAEAEWLDRHGHMWLTNADGTTGRKLATLAEGVVSLTGQTWVAVPVGQRLINHATEVEYETTEAIVLAPGGYPTPVPVRALDAGMVGNLPQGTSLALLQAPPGVDGAATVVLIDGGIDDEETEDLRGRVLLRIRQPPMGGAAIDYRHWALAVAGVTRAWAYPLEMGMGTVTVRFMADSLRADEEGFPRQFEIDRVIQYLDSVRPVAVKDCFVVAPIRHAVNVEINRLVPDTTAVRLAIAESLKEMLRERAEPGGVIYAAWKNFAIMQAPGVISFFLGNSRDDVMPSPGHMPVLGNIIYGQ